MWSRFAYNTYNEENIINKNNSNNETTNTTKQKQMAIRLPPIIYDDPRRC